MEKGFVNEKYALGINSLGRIGKLTLWNQIHRRHFREIAVNQGRDVGPDLEAVCQTIEKDSTYGSMHRFLYGVNAKPMIRIENREKRILRIGDAKVTFLNEGRNPKDIKWGDHNVKIVAECTGNFGDPTVEPDDKKGSITGHLHSEVQKVINSSAFKVKNKSKSLPESAGFFMYGINHDQYDHRKHHIISAASCTTTGLANMLKPLIDKLGHENFLAVNMLTIHAATNTQSILDSVPKAGTDDLRKSRASLNNLILTTTNAQAALVKVMKEVKNMGFLADSLRVPMTTESLILLNLVINQPKGKILSKDDVNSIYKDASKRFLPNTLVYSDEQNVSIDMMGMNASVVIEGYSTATNHADLGDSTLNFLKIYGWYDNEYGSYTNRFNDLITHIDKQLMETV